MSPDVHTEAVQAALAKHKERKMAVPMPSKRRSLVVQTSMDAYTPPGMEPNTGLQQTKLYKIITPIINDYQKHVSVQVLYHITVLCLISNHSF